jgi:hypothetical protein
MATDLIRNLFDQYRQPENRLTHALAQILARDQHLTRDFVRVAVGVDPPDGLLSLSCQAAPGDLQPPPDEEDVERHGIPDLWIWSEAHGWAVLCESKVTAAPTREQLTRHVVTARRRGFKAVRLLVITADELRPGAVARRIAGVPVAWTSWSRLYAFLAARAHAGYLVPEFLNYLHVVEGQLMAEGHDTPPLTTFTGIPFGADHPYTEPEAKVVLRALMIEFRRRLAASPVLRINPSIRRGAPTGAWDVVGFKFARSDLSFNKHVHLSLGIASNHVRLALILPRRESSGCWTRIRRVSQEQLKDTLAAVAERLRPVRRQLTRDVWEPQLNLRLLQRHFYAQRMGTIDGDMKFDVDTLSKRSQKPTAVKTVPAWLEAFHTVLAQTARANFELALMAEYPLVDGSATRRADFPKSLVTVAEAYQPFLEMLLAKHAE